MKKSANLSDVFHNVIQIIQKSLAGGDSLTRAEEIIAFITVTSLIAFILYLVAFCRKTLKPNAENIAPMVIVLLMGISLVVTIYGYVTEGFFLSMVLLWIFSGITLGIGSSMGLFRESDSFGSVIQETMSEWKAEDKYAGSLEGKSIVFSDGSRGTIRGEDIESSMEKWGMRLGGLGVGLAIGAAIIGPLVWIVCVLQAFYNGCISFNKKAP
ncbi:hypothetical protein [Akkermansia sp.]|uniref:hypothetical protein n=1 Tax=Akkermansia sp. TaxID=1872421 RepID=UPI0025BC880B|nr:hypothetical protein [Akkermansia sp.]MCC8149546.1 hypothetical protein [Akkermansia sp.]